MALNPTLARGLRPGGTRGPGTRRPRKPELLAILRDALAGGAPAWRVERKAAGKPFPRRPTYRHLAEIVLEELAFRRYMAAEHDEARPRDDEAARRFRESVRQRFRGFVDPTDEHIKKVYEGLSRTTNEYGEAARRLEQELGPRFLNGTWEVRAEMLRDWVRNWREQGRLPAASQQTSDFEAELSQAAETAAREADAPDSSPFPEG